MTSLELIALAEALSPDYPLDRAKKKIFNAAHEIQRLREIISLENEVKKQKHDFMEKLKRENKELRIQVPEKLQEKEERIQRLIEVGEVWKEEEKKWRATATHLEARIRQVEKERDAPIPNTFGSAIRRITLTEDGEVLYGLAKDVSTHYLVPCNVMEEEYVGEVRRLKETLGKRGFMAWVRRLIGGGG